MQGLTPTATLEGREIPCLCESSYFSQPGGAAQPCEQIWLQLRDRWAEEGCPSLRLLHTSTLQDCEWGSPPLVVYFLQRPF